jgi:hypothetical protein
MNELRCYCGRKLRFEVKVSETREQEKETELKKCLEDYWQWIAEGKKKYRDEQYYYDTYHNYVEYLEELDTYEFNIQVSDSPTGDTWWEGEFKLDGQNIKVTKEKYWRN